MTGRVSFSARRYLDVSSTTRLISRRSCTAQFTESFVFHIQCCCFIYKVQSNRVI